MQIELSGLITPQVPFWEDCSEIMLNMGFDACDFDLKALSVFVQGDGVSWSIHKAIATD